MYWMLRVLTLQPLAATAGAVAFMFNGFVIAWLGWPLTNVAIWFPLLVGLTERLRETGAWQYVGWLSLVTAVQFLGGHPETSFHLLVVLACYALYRASGPAPVKFLAQFAVGGALGGLLAAAQLLPFLHYLSQSAGFVARRETHLVHTLSPRAIIALLIPNYFGSPASRNFWGPANYNEISGSAGVLPWVLAPCALLGGWSRRGIKFFLTLPILIGLVVYDARPFPWILSTLPGFSIVANNRLIVVLPFSLATLCGIGMEILINPPPDARSRIITGIKVSFALLLMMLAGYLIADHERILHKGLSVFVAAQCGTFLLLLTAGALISIYALRRGARNITLGICLLSIELVSIYPLRHSTIRSLRPRSFIHPLRPWNTFGTIAACSGFCCLSRMSELCLASLISTGTTA
jgi:hypothetical protein